MKYFFAFIFTLFTTLPVSLYSAQRSFDNPSNGYDFRVDWRALYRDRLQLNKILKNILLSTTNKTRIYKKCSVLIDSLGLETIINTLIDYAAINNSADLNLFCQHVGKQLSKDTMQNYKKRLMMLNALEKVMLKILSTKGTVDCDTLRCFLEQGARINAQNKYGNTALILAVCADHTECVRLLLKHPTINVNVQDMYGDAALILAACAGRTECVRLLLKHPTIDVNTQGEYGNTALILAASAGHTECVRLLLKHPTIDVNTRNV